jgi:NUBPL iron-transfer P-loop NTPase
LAVLQELQLSGSVAVTTPSKLAVADTLKGIEMFTSLGVPTMAVVENMSFFEDELGKRHFPFGHGLIDQVNNSGKRQFASKNIVKLPMSMATTEANETATPLTMSRPENGADNELSAYNQLAQIVCQQLLHTQYGSDDSSKEYVCFGDNAHEFDVASIVLSLDNTKSVPPEAKKFVIRIFSKTGAKQIQVLPSIFRASDPRTGELILDSPFLTKQEDNDIISNKSIDPMVATTKVLTRKSPSIVPSSVSRRGRYGFQVVWQDGATIIYSNMCIAKCAGGKTGAEGSRQ